ncbi:type II toxin-antitoxin system RelE/ParE family toxin [bacterium]|nr:type II toxin-antitoxin system RelE/ParE family toxin [bacterium]
MTYRLTPQARDGFRRILTYVEEEFGSRVAERVLDDLEAAFATLAASPGLGHLRTDITPNENVRFWPVGPSLIAYRDKPGAIEILFIERGDRDWRAMLEHDL